MAWTCPECERRFGRKGQSHVCEPGLTVDEFFSAQPAEYREIHDVIADYLGEMGPLIVEPVEVGIFYKRNSTFAQLRPRKSGGSAVSMVLSRRLDHARITRRTPMGKKSPRTSNAVTLRSARDVDEDVLEWLAEAWFESPE